MFDIGFGELLLIAVLALVVLGPERLPKAARMFGTVLRRVRNGWESVREEVEREIEAEEMKRKLKEAQEFMRQTSDDVDRTVREEVGRVRRAGESVRQAVDGQRGGDDAGPDAAQASSEDRGQGRRDEH